jgi:acyl-CoA hydrolase
MDEQGKPQTVPELVPETDVEQQRFEEAALRRSSRLAHANELRALRSKAGRSPD